MKDREPWYLFFIALILGHDINDVIYKHTGSKRSFILTIPKSQGF